MTFEEKIAHKCVENISVDRMSICLSFNDLMIIKKHILETLVEVPYVDKARVKKVIEDVVVWYQECDDPVTPMAMLLRFNKELGLNNG